MSILRQTFIQKVYKWKAVVAPVIPHETRPSVSCEQYNDSGHGLSGFDVTVQNCGDFMTTTVMSLATFQSMIDQC